MNTATSPNRDLGKHDRSEEMEKTDAHPREEGEAQWDVEVLKCVPSGFSIDSAESANWLVRKIVEARRYAQQVQAWADQELRRAEREERTLTFLYGRQIEDWVRSEIANLGGRRKSIALPGGTVGFRTINSSLQIDDDPSVLIWAKENCPSAVAVAEKLSRSAIKQHFERTGEMPEQGAHVEPSREQFFVR